MSFEIFWDKLDDQVALDLKQYMNNHLETVTRPDFMGPIKIDDLGFGDTPPEIQVVDLTDPLAEFYMDVIMQEYRTRQREEEYRLMASRASSHRDPIYDKRYPLHRTAAAHSSSTLPYDSLPPSSPFKYSDKMDWGGITSPVDPYSFDDETPARIGLFSPSIQAKEPESIIPPSLSKDSSFKSSAQYIHRTNLPSPLPASSLVRPVSRTPSWIHTARTSDHSDIPYMTNPTLGVNAMHPEPEESPTVFSFDRHDPLLQQLLEKAVQEHNPSDLQLEVLVAYNGNMTMTLSTELIIHQPTPFFLVLPMTLKLTGFSFRAHALLVYLGDKVHFCFKEQESGESPLQDVSIESEVGDKNKQVLKNVGKIERFIVDQLRKLIEDKWIFPSYHSIELIKMNQE